MAECRKTDSYDRKNVHVCDKINQLTEEKKRCCRVKAELEQFYEFVDKLEEKARQINVKKGNKKQTEKSDNRKSKMLHEDFLK